MKNLNFKSYVLIVLMMLGTGIMYSQTNAPVLSAPGTVNSGNGGYFVQDESSDKEHKKSNYFKVFGCVNFNKLIMDEKLVKPATAVGWLVGASYQQGRFVYWEVGAVYNNMVYNLLDTTIFPSVLDGVFSTQNIDIPVKVGVNFLFFASRIVGLRVYLGAVPSFAVGVGDNKLKITKDKINTFNIYGQGGIGVDVAFIFVEAGYNYGFIDLFTNDIQSNPNQIFINLGFRF